MCCLDVTRLQNIKTVFGSKHKEYNGLLNMVDICSAICDEGVHLYNDVGIWKGLQGYRRRHVKMCFIICLAHKKHKKETGNMG